MKVTERVARLAILTIVLIVVVVAGCDRAMTVGKTVMPDPTEEVTPSIDLLIFPGDDGEDWTDEERNQWWEAVRAAAVNVNLLNITGCTPDPVVIQVELGESIQIYNDDATDHTLHWGGHFITIPAGDTIDIVLSDVFGPATGALGYGCDDGPTAGIFLVDEPPPINPLLVFPGEDWTEEESERWWEAVRAAAVNVNLLNITGCTPDPLVIEVESGESIQIYNDDAIDHTLTRGGNSITVPAFETINIVISDFLETGEEGIVNSGAYDYVCDGVWPSVGIFYVVDPPPSE